VHGGDYAWNGSLQRDSVRHRPSDDGGNVTHPIDHSGSARLEAQ
jgi:hypothetical protein